MSFLSEELISNVIVYFNVFLEQTNGQVDSTNIFPEPATISAVVVTTTTRKGQRTKKVTTQRPTK